MTHRELYRANDLPVLQNRVFDTFDEAVACQTGDVVLIQDGRTGLVRNEAFRPELLQYDANYQNEQAESRVFQQHLRDVARIIEKHFMGDSLIEVGCGKGRFLDLLVERGFEVTGLDPAYEGENPRIVKEYFSETTGIRADGIILRHVLEHIENPVAFLASLRDANDGGKIYIEVPCFDWISRHAAWFDIFYEHVNYFRLSDFERIFGNVYEISHTFGGQYLFIVADLSSVRDPADSAFSRATFPSHWRESMRSHAERISSRGPGNSAVWGAASKGVIFSLFMQQAGAPIGTVVDINPVKQRKYLPRTGVRISSPAEALRKLPANSDIYVMNSNYLGEIRSIAGDSFTYLTLET